jgi:hypothetical protein
MFEAISMSPWAGSAFALSIAMFFGSLIAVPILVARMRPDYFLTRQPTEESWSGRHQVTRITVLLLKNLIGVVLVLAGIAMLVLPGQGFLTILIGMTLLNFPGKRKLELRIFRLRPVSKAINWVRTKAKQPPLILPDKNG